MLKHLRVIRWSVVVLIALALLCFIYAGEKKDLNTSDLILLVTAVLIAWYSFETLSLVELTRIKDQPFLDIEFPRNGRKILLVNSGATPAYSASITPLRVGDSTYSFDPLWVARVSILPGEKREVWMYHKHKDGSSYGDSVSLLHGQLIKDNEAEHSVEVKYFDKDGIELRRTLYIRGGGSFLDVDMKVYATTSKERIPTSKISS